MTCAKPSLDPAALLALQRYFPACRNSAFLTNKVPVPFFFGTKILPLIFDQVTGSDGLTTQLMLNAFPSLTEISDGVMLTLGGAKKRE